MRRNVNTRQDEGDEQRKLPRELRGVQRERERILTRGGQVRCSFGRAELTRLVRGAFRRRRRRRRRRESLANRNLR